MMMFEQKLLFSSFLILLLLKIEAAKIPNKTNHDYKTITKHGKNGAISSSEISFGIEKNQSPSSQQKSNSSTSSLSSSLSQQAKRDLSLSYTATDIDSKEGARVKTITVIKNLNKDGKNAKLIINPQSYKNDNWADAFRDNFDEFGKIPDVPDIDDLFEFVNKKSKSSATASSLSSTSTSTKSIKSKEKEIKMQTLPPQQTTFSTKKIMMMTKSTSLPPSKTPQSRKIDVEPVKPVIESTIEMITEIPKTITEINKNSDRSGSTVEKIKGDAELITSHGGGKQKNVNNNGNIDEASAIRSQSLSLTSERLREELINVNYSTPKHSVHQYFENYIQAPGGGVGIGAAGGRGINVNVGGGAGVGYDYPRPCINNNLPTSSVSVNTPSGRTYDVPSSNNAGSSNNGIINPYIAPSLAKRPLPQQPQQTINNINTNQLLPPFPFQNPNQNPNQQQLPPPPQSSYSVNSIVPPIQNNLNTIRPINQQQTPIPQNVINNNNNYNNNNNVIGQVGFSTSQRPYVAPSLRNGLGYSRGPPPTPAAYGGGNAENNAGSPNYRINSYGIGGSNANKPNFGRSRGLKY